MKNEHGQLIAERAWTEFLGPRPALTSEDFFTTGGHSMLLLRMAAWIKSESGQDLVLADFLQQPTLAGLARCLEIDDCHRVRVQEFGSGRRTILCVPGSYGRAIAFSRLADAIGLASAEPTRLRCYELWNVVEELGASAAIDAVADQIERDLRAPGVVGIAGYSLGGLFPFIRDYSAGRETLRLWVIDSYMTFEARSRGRKLLEGIGNAIGYPLLLPGGFRATLRERWRRPRPAAEADTVDHPRRWQLQGLLGGMIAHPWRGPATLIRRRHRTLWNPYYAPSKMNGLRGLLREDARSVPVSSTHIGLLTSGVQQVANAISSDLDAEHNARD